MLGQITEGEGERLVGNKVVGTPKVKTLDCCCCLVHSSLLLQRKLRFDENLKFLSYPTIPL